MFHFSIHFNNRLISISYERQHMAGSIKLCLLLPNIRSFITQFYEKTPYFVRIPPQTTGALLLTKLFRGEWCIQCCAFLLIVLEYFRFSNGLDKTGITVNQNSKTFSNYTMHTLFSFIHKGGHFDGYRAHTELSQ